MKLPQGQSIVLILVCAVITCVAYTVVIKYVLSDVLQGTLSLCIASGIVHLTFVSLSAAILFKNSDGFGMHKAAIFTFSAMLATRIFQQFYRDPINTAILEGTSLLLTCLLVYGAILLRQRAKNQTSSNAHHP